jgi:hypothetical protein
MKKTPGTKDVQRVVDRALRTIKQHPLDPREDAAKMAHAALTKRDDRTAAIETIGCALAVLRRLDYCSFDTDIRDTITKARSALSVAQSKIKERVNK